jgi:Winged helix DNA-binding domain
VPRRIDPESLPRRRAAAQLLHRPASVADPAQVARAVCGVQAQDPYPARLSFRSRSRRLTGAGIDRARTEERSLLRTWLMRKTIHMIPTEDAGWMLPLFEPMIEQWARGRLEQLGMPASSVAKALRVAKQALEREGPLTRPQVRERIAAAGIELDSQTGLHIIGLEVTSGIACLGPDRGRTTCLVLRDDWLGERPRFDRETALAELARRYLAGFGPAGEDDFSKWSGLPLRDLRAGLARISPELQEARVGEHTLLTLRGRSRRSPPPGVVRMLGAFDTYMLGYKNRDFAVAPEHRAAIKSEAGGGLIRPVIVEDGIVIGSWRYSRAGGAPSIQLDSFLGLPQGVRRALEGEVADIGRFEGAPVHLAEERDG